MTAAECMEDIKNHPEKHKHDFISLQMCCTVDGAVDLALMEAHPALGWNGGTKCDVSEGPCACGGWH